MGNTNTSQKGKTCYSICFENPTPGNDNAANSYDPNYVPQNQSQNQNGNTNKKSTTMQAADRYNTNPNEQSSTVNMPELNLQNYITYTCASNFLL